MILFTYKHSREHRLDYPNEAYRETVEIGPFYLAFNGEGKSRETGEWNGHHADSVGVSITKHFKLGSDHYYYDGYHCSFHLGFIHFYWNGFLGKKCDKCYYAE